MRAEEGWAPRDRSCGAACQHRDAGGTGGGSPAHTPEAMRQKLKEQLARILGETSQLDEARLYQEAALLATRADVEEELKRLGAHIAAARALLNAKEPSGRASISWRRSSIARPHTLCSKSADTEITRMVSS